jgi:dTDP-4-amino-4,6-dideoxygalactose transaminase
MQGSTAYSIPLFDLNYDHEEEEAVLATLRSRWISTGPRTAEFEKRFAEALGARHAVAVANCTCALHLALQIVGVREGDEVIVPSLTFVATANAVRYVRATPVFCDIRGPKDLNIDPEQIESLITEKTRAIVVMHYGGFPCDMDRILELARKHRLRVVEDACHGPLSEHGGRKLGTIGDIGCFSFFSNKNISTGEGGMLVTGDAEFAERARLLRSHGMTTLSYQRASGHSTRYDVIESGYNYRMDDIHAALGIVQLGKLRDDIGRRAIVRNLYLDALADARGILIPFGRHHDVVSNYIFPVILEGADANRRDAVRDAMHERGIQTSIHYPAVHRFSSFEPYRRPLPKTEHVSDSLVTLPMHGRLSADDVSRVAGTLRELTR